MSIIALDPGNSTGYCFRRNSGDALYGGTIGSNHLDVWNLLEHYKPDVIVFETFQMYPGKAQKLIWNSFYPVEVIGVIKIWYQLRVAAGYSCTLVGLQPSVKKFALADSEHDLWKSVHICDASGKATEHTRDAVRLLRYYERNSKKA